MIRVNIIIILIILIYINYVLFRPSSAPSSLAPHGSKRRIQATSTTDSAVYNSVDKVAPVVAGRQQNVQGLSTASADEVTSPDPKVRKNTPPHSPTA